MAVSLPPFWSLVEAHGDELLVHAKRLAGDEHGEDVLQDALLRALRAYPRLRHADHLRAWLYRVTTSAAMDHHRRRRREVLTDDVETAAGRTRPREFAGHDAYDDGTFEALIAPLPETARSALRLRFVDDLDYDGIADRLGCSAVAARQRVSTAVRTLRETFA
jgi:RNA polymerase sigma-70 factor (ECF subfamily)